MFLGTYEYRIDEKGRISLPPRFRDELRQGMVMTQGLEKCITVYSLAEWQRVSDRMAAQPANRSKARRIGRFTFATAFMADLDAQGRVAIPAPLRRYAGIEDAVVVAGVNNYFEIWSTDSWEAESSLMENEAWQISEGIEESTVAGPQAAAPHTPVLLQASVELIKVRPGGRFVDGTVGTGGHAEAILQGSSPGGPLLGIDADPKALEIAGRRLAPYGAGGDSGERQLQPPGGDLPGP